MAWLDRSARSIFLWDLVSGFIVGMKYFFAPKKTLNFPFERGPLSPRFRGEHVLRQSTLRGKSAVSPASCARRSALHSASSSRPSRVKTAAAAPRATTST